SPARPRRMPSGLTRTSVVSRAMRPPSLVGRAWKSARHVLERRGFELRGARLLKIPRSLAQQHYAEHKGKPFFGDLVTFITSGPVLAVAVRGESAISVVRTMMGATNPLDSAPGTIRGDLALELSENIVHGSDSKASARRELALFFPDGLV
ncbi:MAG TPA: nucleoside-diphosphate kinase, partial [Gaiellaceae bacterium]|nr:nucleoside-diphosphate kinase [Gaiellaceae bacterium]